MPSSALDLLAAHRFFHDLPPTQLETLSASLQSCRFPAGDLPFRSGEQARRCLLLGDGEVQVLRFGQDGEERVLGQFGRGELIAVAALFMADGRYPASARAQTAVSGWWLPREALHRLCAAHPALSLRLLQSVSGSLLRSVDWASGWRRTPAPSDSPATCWNNATSGQRRPEVAAAPRPARREPGHAERNPQPATRRLAPPGSDRRTRHRRHPA